MNNLVNWVSLHPYITVGIAAFACGVALLYLVMRRTMKHRG